MVCTPHLPLVAPGQQITAAGWQVVGWIPSISRVQQASASTATNKRLMSCAFWCVTMKVTLVMFFVVTPNHHNVAFQPLHMFLKSSRLHSHSLLLTMCLQTIIDWIRQSMMTLSVMMKDFMLYMFAFVHVRFIIRIWMTSTWGLRSSMTVFVWCLLYWTLRCEGLGLISTIHPS